MVSTQQDEVKTLELNKEALKDTIIIADPKSTESTLTNGKKGVTVHYEGYEWLAFWSPSAPFVCIEPWHSHTDFEEVHCEYKDREGTIALEPHTAWYSDYSITVF